MTFSFMDGICVLMLLIYYVPGLGKIPYCSIITCHSPSEGLNHVEDHREQLVSQFDFARFSLTVVSISLHRFGTKIYIASKFYILHPAPR